MDDIHIEVSYDVFNYVVDSTLNYYCNDDDDNTWRVGSDALERYRGNPLSDFIVSEPAYKLFAKKVPAKYRIYLASGVHLTHTITE